MPLTDKALNKFHPQGKARVMSFDYKYLHPKEGEALSGRSEKSFQYLDTELSKLKTEKGEYHARTVEFLVQVRLMNATLPEKLSLASARFVGHYVTFIVSEKFGDNVEKAMKEFVADADRISLGVVESMKS
jgi:hypothetical protein